MKKLSIKQILSVSMMLFAIFFGAGNMIFPPAMGQMAGSAYIWALLGFIVTDAGIAILGITAIVLLGNSMSDLGGLLSKKFANILSIGVYLLIGPLFALPRTGSVSFELATLPYVNKDHTVLASFIFTALFFLVTYYLSSNPKKIVDVVGKILTPILLISIFAMFLAAIFNIQWGNGTLTYGMMHEPVSMYASHPFFQGMIEGYNALDDPAGLAFSIIVINAIRELGIKDRKSIAKYTIYAGIGAAGFLATVYFMLTYIGAITNTEFSNGGALLHALTSQMFGTPGGIILGIAVLLACLTTSIGLTTSFSDYFHDLKPSWSYKKIAACVCVFSFAVSNVGLTQLVKISLPVLIMIYPVTVVLIILSFFHHKIQDRKFVYVLGMLFTFMVSCISGLDSVNITIPIFSTLMQRLPFYALGIGWIIPAILGSCIGCLPFWKAFRKTS